MSITTTIDAHERREVAVAELQNTYLHLFAGMDGIIHKVMCGQLTELMTQTASQIS